MEVPGAVNLTATSYFIHNMFELQKKCWMDGAIALLQPQSPPNELEGRDVGTDSRWVEHWNRIITCRLENTACGV